MTGAFLEWAREELASEGVEIRQAFSRVAAVAATIPPERAPALALLPYVDHVEPVMALRLASQSVPWGVDSIHAVGIAPGFCPLKAGGPSGDPGGAP